MSENRNVSIARVGGLWDRGDFRGVVSAILRAHTQFSPRVDSPGRLTNAQTHLWTWDKHGRAGAWDLQNSGSK